MPPRPARWPASAMLGLVVACSFATVWLDAVTSPGAPGVRVAYAESGSAVLVPALVLAGCAWVVLRDRPRDRVGWVMGGFAVFWVVDALAQSWVRFGVRSDGLLPGVRLAFWLVDQAGAFLPLGIPLLFLVYPTGRFLRGRWGAVSAAAVGLMVLTGLAVVLGPARPLPPEGAALEGNPTALPLPRGVMGAVVEASTIGALVAIVLTAATVIRRYRLTRDLDRDRMRWLLWGLVAELFVATVVQVVDARGPVTYALVVGIPAVAVTVGLVRPQLVDIDALLTGTLVYGATGLLILLVDLLVLAGIGAALGDALQQQQAVVLVLLLSALVYGPLRERLRRLTRRLVLGQRENRYDLVAGLASRLEQASGPDDQLAVVASAVASAFGVPFVSVEVDRTAGERVVATYGRLAGETRSLPVSYRGEEVGRLILPRRGVRARLSARDEQLLGDLVRQAATAARTSRLAEELQVSRERLVLAREEERRRIRRDLHDGLGPVLSGVVFRVDAARMQLPAGPSRDLLVQVRDEVQTAIADVRRLVHDLRPPALDDLGLVGALRDRADLALAGGLTVELDADGLPDLPAAVEVAAYRIIGEAMTNTVRHAAATRCRIALRVEGDDLCVEVVDDGRGIPADALSGVGLSSLRERAAELGGHTEVTCPPDGGTRVVATLPLRSRP